MGSGPGEARTILLLHIISVRHSKQPLMVRTFLKVYMELGSSFLFLQEQIKDIIIIIGTAYQLRRELREAKPCNNNKVPMPNSLHGHENSFLIILSSLLKRGPKCAFSCFTMYLFPACFLLTTDGPEVLNKETLQRELVDLEVPADWSDDVDEGTIITISQPVVGIINPFKYICCIGHELFACVCFVWVKYY